MAASAPSKHSSSAVPFVNDATASFDAKASFGRPRCARSETKEETMRVLAITELMRLIRIELCDLVAHITNTWPDYPEGSEEQQNAHINSVTFAAF